MRNNIVNCESQLWRLLFYSFFYQICENSMLCLIYYFSSSLTKCVMQLSYLKDDCQSSRYKHWQPLFVCLEVDWFEFHFSSLSGVVISLPAMPVHTITTWRVASAMIEAVQVGVMTAIVPPSPLVNCSTVTRMLVIVLIFSGERGAFMIT